MLPNQAHCPYRRTVLQWAALNPEYKIFLWLDKQLLAINDYERIAAWCTSHKIEAREAEEVIRVYSLSDFYQQECTAHRYAAAADILRYCLLAVEGGVYLDVDVLPGPQFGTFQAELGFCCPYVTKKQRLWAMLPHALASCAQHPLLSMIITRLRRNYDLLTPSDEVQWRNTNDVSWRYSSTICVTGDVILPACYQVGGLLTRHLEINEHFRLLQFPWQLQHQEDHSWLNWQAVAEYVYPDAYMERQRKDVLAVAETPLIDISELYERYGSVHVDDHVE